MSTKSTIAYGPDFHLFNETFDDSYVYLHLEGAAFEASPDSVKVSIPIHIWEFIRQFPAANLDWVGKSDQDIRFYVEREVDDWLAQFAQIDNGNRKQRRFMDSIVYGSADESREKQIEAGTLHFKKLQDHQQQICEAIQELNRNNLKP